MKQQPWSNLGEFEKVHNRWLTLIGEKLQDDQGKILEYWRVEKPDGLIVIVEQDGQLLLPKQMYRPGIGEYTLDFCGGRLNPEIPIQEAAQVIVQREFHLQELPKFTSFKSINNNPWHTDSSFTNVRLYGYVASLDNATKVNTKFLAGSYGQSESGINKLLDELVCLQCRALLLEWLRQSSLGISS